MGVINSLKQLLAGSPPEDYEAPPGIPAPDRSRKLILYKFDSCPWCRIVQKVVEQNEVQIEYRDTRKDNDARDQLRKLTGKTQVPCLFIDGTPFFESRDIKRWLQTYIARGYHQHSPEN